MKKLAGSRQPSWLFTSVAELEWDGRARCCKARTELTGVKLQSDVEFEGDQAANIIFLTVAKIVLFDCYVNLIFQFSFFC